MCSQGIYPVGHLCRWKCVDEPKPCVEHVMDILNIAVHQYWRMVVRKIGKIYFFVEGEGLNWISLVLVSWSLLLLSCALYGLEVAMLIQRFIEFTILLGYVREENKLDGELKSGFFVNDSILSQINRKWWLKPFSFDVTSVDASRC